MKNNKCCHLTFYRIKDFFRRNPKTTWGKNELVKELDELQDLYEKEAEEDLK